MKTRIIVAVVLLAFAAPSFAQKVTIDYDKDYDFSTIQTYSWVEPEEFEKDPLMNQRIVNAIDYQLTMAGARQIEKVDANADVYVTYHSNSKEQYQINSTNFGYGYGPGWGYHGGATGRSTSSVYRYEVGTLIIDVRDAESKNLIWRGTAEATISPKPEKMEKKIKKAITKLSSKWDKLVQKDVKQKEKAAKAAAGS